MIEHVTHHWTWALTLKDVNGIYVIGKVDEKHSQIGEPKIVNQDPVIVP